MTALRLGVLTPAILGLALFVDPAANAQPRTTRPAVVQQTVPPRPVARQVASDDVPAALSRRARDLTERAAAPRRLLEGRSIYITTEKLRVKADNGEEGRPLYQVTHYRYADDTAIVSVVDLERGEVLSQREVPHLPVMLTVEELAQARELALAQPAVREALARYPNVTVEPLLVRVGQDRDPWFGHRVVRLLFRVNRDYLTRPIVYVDLTTSRVQIGEEAHQHD